ncbi:MAG: hypothetical protein ABW000_11955 [Actinoplanes sp.]
MTGAEFSGVDIDLLADYVGGALDGTPDEAVVAALIVDDPAWRDAHALLSGGVATVSAQLHALPPEPMPAMVIARLDAALSQAATTADSETQAATTADTKTQGEMTADSETRGGTTTDTKTQGGTPAGGVAPVRQLAAVREKRRRRWAAPVGIAAGVLAFAGFGVQEFAGDSAEQTASSSAGGSAENAPAMDTNGTLALPAGPAEVSTSGTNYSRQTLGDVSLRSQAVPPEPFTASSGKERKLPAPSRGAMADDDALSRLRVQEALLACINAIADGNGAGAVTAQTVDYARFDGVPAVIVRFTATNGSWVWAVGPECGARGGDADKLGVVKVG